MTKTRPAVLSSVVGLGVLASTLAACGSSSNGPSGVYANPPDAGPPEASAPDVAAVDGGAGGAGADAAFPPPLGTRLGLPDAITLVGSGTTSCTHAPGATGDRWCGILAAPPNGLGARQLWVFDATAAARGAAILCDGTDARCLKLTAAALSDDFSASEFYTFQGDTLFYRAGDGTNAATLEGGPVWAWRPGWTAGRELVFGQETACTDEWNRGVALCLVRVQDATTGDITEEISAGPLEGASGPLPSIVTVLERPGSLNAGVDTEFSAGASPDGAYVAWTTTDPTTMLSMLTAQAVADATTRKVVATDVTSWRISSDGTHWLWLRGFADDLITPSGTLETADFPSGANAATLALKVAQYDLVGAQGVLFRTSVADQVGELRLMPDRAAPATTQLLDQGVRFVVARSADAGTVIYSKTNTAVGADLYAWSAGLAAPCTLTAVPSAATVATLLAGNQVVAWADIDVQSQLVSGAVTTLASCATKSLGSGLVGTAGLGDDRLLYVDGAPLGAYDGTLRVTRVGADGAAGAGAPIAHDVAAVFATVAPSAVVYTVDTGTAADGVYVYAGSLLTD